VTAEYAPSGEPEPTVSPELFRAAAGKFATGVTVVTTCAGGVDHAMTANAFTSVSLKPLLVLVCVEKVTRFHEAILDSGLWAVSVLGDDAHEASVWFATRGRRLENQLDRFRYVRGGYTRAAILTDALSSLECRTYAVHDGGDHSIVVGEVLSATVLDGGGDPLLYYGGAYRHLSG
jgi:flavin reductase (DIM6/NTAB) family NADH-FMN oxidoreductase RutF